MHPCLLLLAALLTGAGGVQAEIYRWVDEAGRVQFGDRPPLDGTAEEVRLGKINTFEGVSVEDNDDVSASGPPPARSRNVVMYSAPWCGVCKRAKRFFQDRGIPFREMDVETNNAARHEFQRMNGRGVPVILVGEKRMNGFSEQEFMKLYGM